MMASRGPFVHVSFLGIFSWCQIAQRRMWSLVVVVILPGFVRAMTLEEGRAEGLVRVTLLEWGRAVA